MSQHISDGRPPQDGQFQNLKSVSTFVASKLTSHEVNSNVLIAGEIVAENGSIANLNVENLTIANSGSLIPFPGFIALPLVSASLSGSASYAASTAPVVTLTTPLTDYIRWSTFVPASSTAVKVYVTLKSALGSNIMNVTVNGTIHAVPAANEKSVNASYVYSTAAFNWLTSGTMTLSVSLGTGTGPVLLGDSVYIAN